MPQGTESGGGGKEVCEGLQPATCREAVYRSSLLSIVSGLGCAWRANEGRRRISWPEVVPRADPESHPRRLIYARMTSPDGAPIEFQSSAYRHGTVGKVLELDVEAGIFLFDFDLIFGVIVFWDPILALCFLLAYVALFWFAQGSLRSLMVKPLETMLSALVSAATVIDAEGRFAHGRPMGAPRPHLGEAVHRLLMLVSRYAGPEGGADGDLFREDTGASGGGKAEPAGGEAAAEPEPSEAGSTGRLMLQGPGSGPGVGSPTMRFSPAVLNGLGTPAWTSGALLNEELLQAVHVMFIKCRLPGTLFPREKFVAWAREILERHPLLPCNNMRCGPAQRWGAVASCIVCATAGAGGGRRRLGEAPAPPASPALS